MKDETNHKTNKNKSPTWEEIVERNMIKEPTEKTKTGKTENFAMPKPMELAKLAAMLAPTLQRLAPGSRRDNALKEAMESAMEYYVEAVCFLNELPSDWEKIFEQFGSTERIFQWLQEHAPEQEKLKLDPNKDDDEARQFLADYGLSLKLAKSVLNNFRRSWKTLYPGRENADTIIAQWESTENGKKIYMIPERFLIGMAKHAKQRSSETKQKGWRTRRK
jgi:hypothetical protein